MVPRKYKTIKTIQDLSKHIARTRKRESRLTRQALRRREVCNRAYSTQTRRLEALSACADDDVRMAQFREIPSYFSDLLRIDEQLKQERPRLAQQARGQQQKLQSLGPGLGTRVTLIEQLAVRPENLDRDLDSLWKSFLDVLRELGFEPELFMHPTNPRKYKCRWKVDGRLERMAYGRFCTIASVSIGSQI